MPISQRKRITFCKASFEDNHCSIFMEIQRQAIKILRSSRNISLATNRINPLKVIRRICKECKLCVRLSSIIDILFRVATDA